MELKQGKAWTRNSDCHGGVEHMVMRRLLLARWLLTEPDKRRLDQSRPGDQMNTSSGDSCLNLTTVDWTRPGDLKTQEKYQLTAVMILNPARPDVRVLRNLVTGNFSPVQTSKSDDLKTVSLYRYVLRVSCLDWEKPVMTSYSSPNQTRAK
ncbi:hypothetical protein Bbelb_151780 [Branchiostoma belcheri]|nr:hypothetical protein Bbelb_151780 [Branchiostoma belcheri]